MSSYYDKCVHDRPNIRPSSDQATVKNIQALRGIAALLVVWTHLKFPLQGIAPQAESWTLIATSHGAIGVDLFFIISGYVICLTACKRHHRPVDFLLARIARVAPIYLLVTVIALVGKNWSTTETHPTWISLWNGLFYLPIFDFGDYTEPPLGAGWTLSFEMWFYTVFALLLNLWKPARVALILPALFLAGAAVMTAYHGQWYFPRFMFHPFVLEFAMGCMVYHVQDWVRGWMPYALLIAGILAMALFTRETGYLGWHLNLLSLRMDQAWLRVLLWGGPWALVAAGLVGLERCHGLVLPRALAWIGAISYSMYLTHRFSLAIVAKAGTFAGLHNAAVACALLLAGSIVFGWLFWMWIEKPLTSRAQQWARKLTATSERHVEATKSSA